MVVEVVSSQDIGLLQKNSSIPFLHFQIVHNKSFGIGGFCPENFDPPVTTTLDIPSIGVGKGIFYQGKYCDSWVKRSWKGSRSITGSMFDTQVEIDGYILFCRLGELDCDLQIVWGCKGASLEVGFRVGLFGSLKDGVSIDSDGGGCQSGEAGEVSGADAWGEDITGVRVVRVEEAIWLKRLVAVSRNSSFCNGEGSDVFEISNYGKGFFSRTNTGRGQLWANDHATVHIEDRNFVNSSSMSQGCSKITATSRYDVVNDTCGSQDVHTFQNCII